MSETFWYFGANWCGPCKQVRSSEVYKRAESKLDLVEVDIDDRKELIKEYDIQSVPTLLVVEDNTVKQRRTGAHDVQERLQREVITDA